MASTLIKTLVAGSLVLSSSIATAQATSAPALQPSVETDLGSNGESGLMHQSDAVTAIIFGLIVFTIAVWIGRHSNDEDDFVPISS